VGVTIIPAEDATDDFIVENDNDNDNDNNNDNDDDDNNDNDKDYDYYNVCTAACTGAHTGTGAKSRLYNLLQLLHEIPSSSGRHPDD